MLSILSSPLAFIGLIVSATIICVPLFYARRHNLAPFYCALFLLLDPFTTLGAEDVLVLKLLRVLCTFLIIISAYLYQAPLQTGWSSAAVMAFALYFAIAGIWSDYPIQALVNKGLIFIPALLAGIMCGTRYEVSHKSARWFIVAAGIFSLILLPEALSYIGLTGRFRPWGLNPVRLGVAGYAFFTLALLGTLTDPKWRYKVLAAISVYGVSIMLLLTGSRGPVGVALIVSACVLVFGFRRNMAGRFAVIVLAIAFVGISALFIDSTKLSYFDREGLSGRDALWETRLEEWQGGTLWFGKGWAYEATGLGSLGSQNLFSIYLQAYIESGIIGVVLFAVALMIVLVNALRAVLAARYMRDRNTSIQLSVALGLLFGSLAIGLVESGPLQGSSGATLLFGMSLGVIDRTLLRARQKIKQSPVRIFASPVGYAAASSMGSALPMRHGM